MVINELEQLKRDNEVLYRDNVSLSETADRLRGALEGIGVLPDGYCFCFNSYRDANKPEHEHTGECREARAALEVKK